MASYSVLITRTAAKEIEAVPVTDRKRIVSRIRALADDPRPSRAEKLSGEDKFRLRHGNYRILYDIIDDLLTVTVVKLGRRREVYRR